MNTLTRIKQRGLSLVELMIAMTIGAIVTVGVIQLFTANSETYNLMQGQSRMQESARFSLDFIGRAVQQAGYKGCFSQNEEVMPNVVEANIPYEFNLMRGMEGYDAQVVGWLPQLTGLDTAFIAGNEIDTDAVVDGTDLLTIRYASQSEAGLVTETTANELQTVVEIPTGGLEFAVDDLAIAHDCEKATIFRLTSLAEGAPAAGQATIGHDSDDVDATRNTTSRLPAVNAYELDAAISAIRTSTFFIAPGVGINNAGDNPLSLWRKFGTGAPVELVEGVEDLQVLYGLDSDNDGTPNQYVGANLVTDFSDVITVRISVTVNSVDDVGATIVPTHGCVDTGGSQACIAGETYDGLLRRTFHQTIQLRNKG